MKKNPQGRLNSGRPLPPVEYQFKPGQSGNPGGKRKKKPFLEEIEKLIEKNPEEVKKVVASMFKRAKAGGLAHARELMDRADGPVPREDKLELDASNFTEALARILARKRGKSTSTD